MADRLRTAAQQVLKAWDTRAGIDAASKAFDALRAALAQQAEPVQSRADAMQEMVRGAEVAGLYELTAEPVQEPVAWADKISFENAMKNGKGHDVWPKAGDYETRTGRALIGIYTTPPTRRSEPEPEPVASSNTFGCRCPKHFAAQQAEPVAWMESPYGAIRANPAYKIKFPSKLLHWQIPLFIAPQQQAEPVACARVCDAADKSAHPADLADAIRARDQRG